MHQDGGLGLKSKNRDSGSNGRVINLALPFICITHSTFDPDYSTFQSYNNQRLHNYRYNVAYSPANKPPQLRHAICFPVFLPISLDTSYETVPELCPRPPN